MNVTIPPVTSPRQPGRATFVPGELIVGLKGPLAAVQGQLAAQGARVIQSMTRLQVVVVQVPVGKEQEIMAKLQTSKAFRYVELNGVVSASAD